ncbi:MAG: thioredoxin-disulfide reductase [Candidatus Omnitrophica bacterium]|nr:thioredoxin-disulfide reductase [Candidatus Omnitrophota bacterium]MCM8792936.1 thioredoxin-disulfide reductase [Candidatus Omnitrophota bacterium]
MKEKPHDLIIIGGGPAGLTSALYAGRAGLVTLILEKSTWGGKLLFTERIENYPGFFEPVFAYKLAEEMKKQAEKFGAELREEEVIEIDLKGKEKIVITHQERIYRSLAVVIATGTRHKELGVPGEMELLGKGVSYCGTCDGPLFKDKEIIVVGGGDTALEETIFLSRFAKRIILIHRRDKLRGTKLLQEKIFSLKNLEISWNSVVTEITGKERVEGVKVKNLKSEKEEFLSCAGVFIFIGVKPETGFIKERIKLDGEGFIITDDKLQTSQEGIFACGDVRRNSLKQIVNACAEGALAAKSVEKYLEEVRDG